MKEEIVREFKKVSSREKAKVLQRFFKTGKGEYGEGDVFVGVVVPNIRLLVRKYYSEMSWDDISFFLHSEVHEFRLFALLVLVRRFEKGDEQKVIYDYYMGNRKWIDSWDLVDLTAPNIVGMYLSNKDRGALRKMVVSKSIWDVRIAVLATFTFIRQNEFKDILEFSKILFTHEHDLIHKAVGWMLREVGKRNVDVLREFLDEYYSRMPRVMLRYAIEKFDKEERLRYIGR